MLSQWYFTKFLFHTYPSNPVFLIRNYHPIKIARVRIWQYKVVLERYWCPQAFQPVNVLSEESIYTPRNTCIAIVNLIPVAVIDNQWLDGQRSYVIHTTRKFEKVVKSRGIDLDGNSVAPIPNLKFAFDIFCKMQVDRKIFNLFASTEKSSKWFVKIHALLIQ